eukprot:ANDGO_08544.mRNA.1 hypothetical protein
MANNRRGKGGGHHNHSQNSHPHNQQGGNFHSQGARGNISSRLGPVNSGFSQSISGGWTSQGHQSQGFSTTSNSGIRTSESSNNAWGSSSAGSSGWVSSASSGQTAWGATGSSTFAPHPMNHNSGFSTSSQAQGFGPVSQPLGFVQPQHSGWGSAPFGAASTGLAPSSFASAPSASGWGVQNTPTFGLPAAKNTGFVSASSNRYDLLGDSPSFAASSQSTLHQGFSNQSSGNSTWAGNGSSGWTSSTTIASGASGWGSSAHQGSGWGNAGISGSGWGSGSFSSQSSNPVSTVGTAQGASLIQSMPKLGTSTPSVINAASAAESATPAVAATTTPAAAATAAASSPVQSLNSNPFSHIPYPQPSPDDVAEFMSAEFSRIPIALPPPGAC